jgi:cell division protein ZapA (FtsZ GTPase activity inhibitor)
MESVKIEIGGDVFSFNAEDPTLLERAGKALDDSINRLYDYYGKNTDYKRLVILAALNSISEIYEEVDKKDLALKQLSEDVINTDSILRQALNIDNEEKL